MRRPGIHRGALIHLDCTRFNPARRYPFTGWRRAFLVSENSREHSWPGRPNIFTGKNLSLFRRDGYIYILNCNLLLASGRHRKNI